MSATRTVGLSLAGVTSLGLAAALHPALVERRAREGLAVRTEAVTGLPPGVAALHAALGPFRGIATGYLWLRTIRLSDEGRPFEALELAEAICRLQPRLEEVWDFRAYELAYNVCVAADDAPTRWLWVKNGIALLRDQAIPMNPGSPLLYSSVVRIYQDRIGGPYDDHHLYFKQELAAEVRAAMGPGADPAALAAAPRTREALAAKDPEAFALLRAMEAAKVDLSARGPDDPALDATLAPFRERPAWPRLEPFLRARATREVLRLDPELMAEIDRSWGPFDWRWCDGHALYWAVLGQRVAAAKEGQESERVNRRLERAALRAVRSAMRRGHVLDLPEGRVFFAPDPRLCERVDQVHARAMERVKAAIRAGIEEEAAAAEDDDGHEHAAPPAVPSPQYLRVIQDSREESLAEAIVILAQYGRDAEAKSLYERLKKLKTDLARVPWEQFLDEALLVEIGASTTHGGGTQASVQALLEGTWTRHFLARALGDDARATGLQAIAVRVHAQWQRGILEKKHGEDDKRAVERLAVSQRLARTNGLAVALRRLPPVLRTRLADQLGLTPEQTEALLRGPPEKPEKRP